MVKELDVVTNEFQKLISSAYEMSKDIGGEVESILKAGLENPLPREEAERLINTVITVLRKKADERGDKQTVSELNGDLSDFIERLVVAYQHIARKGLTPNSTNRLSLIELNGICPHPVLPSPIYHERLVIVKEGFVKITDIKLWDENERLDIHLAQFQRINGRKPNSDELLDIMMSKMDLPGIKGSDQFKIVDLAQSIAVNGVRNPPIIDVDGTLLDGNRRLAACLYILSNDESSQQEKERVEHILVWQLTEHATDDDREAVIVSLNFEPDYKEEWPEYVKANKVYNEWQSMLSREPHANSKRQLEMQKGLSKKFALGPKAEYVKRYIRMVDMAIEFEDYQIISKDKDQYEVKHVSEKYFQYYDELTKGKNPGGVHYELNQDEALKHLVFDLLYADRFKNWKDIRELRYFPGNEEAIKHLQLAREEIDVEKAQDMVSEAIGIVKSQRAVNRMLGLNARIESFVKWFKELPVKVFKGEEPGSITPENLSLLYEALAHVKGYLKSDPVTNNQP